MAFFFYRNRKTTPKIYINHRRPQIGKKKILRKQNTHFKLYYEAVFINTVWHWLKKRPMEQNREPGNKHKHVQSTNICQKYSLLEKRESLQLMELRNLDVHLKKNETGHVPYATHKNQLERNTTSKTN